jgi:AbrB family looped-hinge helix DNA binding protein
MISTVTSKGQVTIPKEIRMSLKINPSDKVDFSVENGRVILKPIKTLKNLRGSVPAKGKGDLNAERQQTKIVVSKKIIEALE